MGDFNIDIGISNSDYDKLKQFCNLFNLQYLIKKEACITKALKSTIDLILTNNPFSFQSSSVIETGISDHNKLIATFFKSHFTRLIPKTVYYRNFKNFDDENSFLNDLKEKIRNWQQMMQMRIIVSLLILSLRLSNVIHL